MQWKFDRSANARVRRLLSASPILAVGSGICTLLIIGAGLALPSTRRGAVEAAINVRHSPVISRPAGHSQPRVPSGVSGADSQRFTGKVGEDLSKSLTAAGVPEHQGREYVAVLARAIQLAGGLSVDDKFDLILQRNPDGTLGQVLYVGLDRVARSDVELMKWTDGRNIIWVNGDGVGGEDQSRMALPLNGRMTSGFGNRFHPILGYERFHAGVDLAAAAGTPIHAAADGRVRQAGWHGGYGQEVEIAHGSGLETRYGHMSRIAASIGEVVRKGQVIGWVGSTGLSTGPHVHFEVMRNGRPVNPMSVKINSRPGHLEGEKLQQFDDTLRGLLIGSRQAG